MIVLNCLRSYEIIKIVKILQLFNQAINYEGVMYNVE